jgi:TRAP-type C4-dicarboxylate transport system permease small subunit
MLSTRRITTPGGPGAENFYFVCGKIQPEEWMKLGRKIIDGADVIIKTIIALSMFTMLAVICLQVFFRFGLNNSLAWPEELARFTMIWSSLLAAVYVQLDRGHLSLDFFVTKFPNKVRAALRILMNLLIIAFMIVTVYGGIQEAHMLMDLKTGALRISRAIPYLAIPISSILFVLATFVLIAKDINEFVKK